MFYPTNHWLVSSVGFAHEIVLRYGTIIAKEFGWW